MPFFQVLDLWTANEWLLLVFSALLIGMAKTGLSGLGILSVPILASVMGARDSTGFVLPMLIVGDIIGVAYYNRHADLQQLIRLTPSTILGIFAGLILGNYIDDTQFRLLLGVVILVGIGLMAWRTFKRPEIPKSVLFAHSMGSMGGFSTMIGNAAGPVLSIYLLAMRLPKNNFIGTSAWFFFSVNIFKVPLQAFVWNTIKADTLTVNLILTPVIIFGAFLGLIIVKRIPERPFKIFVITSVALAAIKMLW